MGDVNRLEPVHIGNGAEAGTGHRAWARSSSRAARGRRLREAEALLAPRESTSPATAPSSDL